MRGPRDFVAGLQQCCVEVPATAHFAERGLAGTRVDAVARDAGVNKERIYQYFGNWEGLFDAVLLRALDCFLTAVPLEGDGVAAVGEARALPGVPQSLPRQRPWRPVRAARPRTGPVLDWGLVLGHRNGYFDVAARGI